MPDIHPIIHEMAALFRRERDLRHSDDEAQKDIVTMDIVRLMDRWVDEDCPVLAPEPIQWGHVELMGHTSVYGRIEKTSEHGISLVRVTQPPFKMAYDGEEKGLGEQVSEHGRGAIHSIHYLDENLVRQESARRRAGVPYYLNIDLVDGVYIASRHADNVLGMDEVFDEEVEREAREQDEEDD